MTISRSSHVAVNGAISFFLRLSNIPPRLLYPFICRWTFRLPPYLSDCKQCCCECWGCMCLFSFTVYRSHSIFAFLMGFSLSYIFLLLFPFRESHSIIPLGYIQYCWNSSFCLSEKFFISSSILILLGSISWVVCSSLSAL